MTMTELECRDKCLGQESCKDCPRYMDDCDPDIEWLNSQKKQLAYLSGSDHPNWKGEEVSYKRLHIWLRKHTVKPDVCEECNKSEPYDLANISGKYKRDISDYRWLCRRCHMNDDDRFKNLLKGNTFSKRDAKGRFTNGDEK